MTCAFVTASFGSQPSTLQSLKPGFLYEIHVRPPAAPDGGPLWPAVAYYTLNAIPQGDGR